MSKQRNDLFKCPREDEGILSERIGEMALSKIWESQGHVLPGRGYVDQRFAPSLRTVRKFIVYFDDSGNEQKIQWLKRYAKL